MGGSKIACKRIDPLEPRETGKIRHFLCDFNRFQLRGDLGRSKNTAKRNQRKGWRFPIESESGIFADSFESICTFTSTREEPWN